MALMSRRKVLFGAGVVVLGGAAFAAAGGRNVFYSLITEETFSDAIDPPTAMARAQAGEIVLLDIRRPDEWAKTGSGEGAIRLDMRREDFIAELDKITGGNRAAPVALICARGVRSARQTNLLTNAGYTNIIDVPEGMLGSAAGPGWIKRGLPLDRS